MKYPARKRSAKRFKAQLLVHAEGGRTPAGVWNHTISKPAPLYRSDVTRGTKGGGSYVAGAAGPCGGGRSAQEFSAGGASGLVHRLVSGGDGHSGWSREFRKWAGGG